VTQGDVHEEIDLLCNLNVEDLKISTLLASTREHPLVFGGVTGLLNEQVCAAATSRVQRLDCDFF
jgi:hypothetical protein